MKNKLKSDELNELREYFRQAVDEGNLDTEDIVNFSKLIEKVNASANDKDSISSMSPDEFLNRLETRINFDDKRPMKIKLRKRFGILIAAAILISGLISGQVAAAFHGTSLFNIVKEKIFGVTFAIADSAPDDFADEKDFAEFGTIVTYDNPDNDKLKDIFNKSVLTVGYIPTGFSKQSSESREFNEEDMYFERYSHEDKYIIYHASKPAGGGILFVRKNGNALERGKKIGAYTVDLFNNGDSILAILENEKILYQIESNLPLVEIEKIIENLK